MKAKRRRHDGAFKARVALEAMKEGKTIHEIAKDNDVHPTQVTDWKKTLVEILPVCLKTANALGRRILKGNASGSIPRSGN